MIFCVNGSFVDETKAMIPVLDNGLLFGDGFYDAMHAYHGVILEWPLHLQRIKKSAKTLNIAMPWTDEAITLWTKQVIEKNARVQHLRVRITITRGVNGFDFNSCKNPTIMIICEEIAIVNRIYEEGVNVATMTLQRLLPQVKTLGLTSMIMAQHESVKKRAFEMIFISERGVVRESASMNVFMVKNKILITPKSEILKGLTRNRVLALAKKMKWESSEEDFTLKRLFEADEIFLTNRLWEIIPVVHLNGKKIGTGKPGPITKKVISAYHEYVDQYVTTHR